MMMMVLIQWRERCHPIQLQNALNRLGLTRHSECGSLCSHLIRCAQHMLCSTVALASVSQLTGRIQQTRKRTVESDANLHIIILTLCLDICSHVHETKHAERFVTIWDGIKKCGAFAVTYVELAYCCADGDSSCSLCPTDPCAMPPDRRRPLPDRCR